MPQSDYNASQNPESANLGLGLSQVSSACPNPLTPPPEQDEHYAPVQISSERQMMISRGPSADNTAAGMAQSQEDSIYLSPAASPTSMSIAYYSDDKDKMDILQEGCKEGTKTPAVVDTYEAEQSASTPSTPVMREPAVNEYKTGQTSRQSGPRSAERGEEVPQGSQSANLDRQAIWEKGDTAEIKEAATSRGLAPIDLCFNQPTTTKPWTFSERRLLPEYPSHVFQSFSRYSGTQQSDRQIYNVDVTLLTVDIAQCTMTGYLLIRGLTPEHDTLQTYFTGEIIGGPARFANEKQSYTFRTANPTWGATEKTDLTHWARFPAWRSLSSHANRDMNFAYPTDGGNWWQQENVFMRWKEHFLVPDHKTKSIAGASFEGFYYICLNQVQGRISGIYYHSKSEKYQRLELKHEGQPDIFNRGVTPCVEFR